MRGTRAPPEWHDSYFANRYSRVDPVVTAKRRRALFVRSGVTVPVEGSFGSILILTLASITRRCFRTRGPMAENGRSLISPSSTTAAG
ncbi:autoinducer binding domain-containing protein [Phyllobacterium sp. YR531]|uniref:autoinducer binding domain-containing protein n=1 Tax=Phyllobacterium sp. YR531 TaxID=1144343 RepID=UPI001FCBC695|nr:autoinducer binding domain-containing protein [Phyllobacterium sp. YR531]